MAGRKQHYIPQFLLRAFAEANSTKVHQVRVVGRDTTFISATDGIAAKREFYSKLGEEDSLDEAITQSEEEYSQIHRELMDASTGDVADAAQFCRLMAHLSLRTGSLRDAMAVSGSYMIRSIAALFSNPDYVRSTMGLGGSELTGPVRDEVDKLYNEHRKKLAKAQISRFELRRLAWRLAQNLTDEQLTSAALPLLQTVLETSFDQTVADGHNKALRRSIEPEERVEALANMNWRIVRPSQLLILPDSVAIGHYEDVGTVPLTFVGNDKLSGALFPFSTSGLLVGGIYAEDGPLEILLKDFQQFAAMNSLNFVVMSRNVAPLPNLEAFLGFSVMSMVQSFVETSIKGKLANAMLGNVTR